jgi:deoxyhypusine synthase
MSDAPIEKRNSYLKEKINPFDPKKTNSVLDYIKNLNKCSFQGRNISHGFKIFEKMVSDESCLVVLTLSGAMIPAGMDEIICNMIEEKMIDVIVSTGANITHAIVNSFSNDSQAHYVGHHIVNDHELNYLQINRIYDTFLSEESYENTETNLIEIIKKINTNIIKPSDFFKFVGDHLPNRCFVKVASEHNIPIFCGATSDSEIALDLATYRENHDHNTIIILDEIGDIIKFGNIISSKEKSGTIIIGGGVPRNWAQQIFPYLKQLTKNNQYTGYSYSIRIHTAVVYDGGLSGCTLSESVSWGKYNPESEYISIWADATIVLPLLVTAMIQKKKCG